MTTDHRPHNHRTNELARLRRVRDIVANIAAIVLCTLTTVVALAVAAGLLHWWLR